MVDGDGEHMAQETKVFVVGRTLQPGLRLAQPKLDLAGEDGGNLDREAMRSSFLERFEDGFSDGAGVISQPLDRFLVKRQ